jgi:hypothetical protein
MKHLHNDELHNVYSSPSIIKIIKSSWMTWAGHIAQMGGEECMYGISWKSRRKETTRNLVEMGWNGLDQSGLG